MKEIIIKNGTVVFENEERKADILIKGEKIAEIFEPGEYKGDAQVIDAEGLHIMPGTIDPHMHLGLYKPLSDAFPNFTINKSLFWAIP